MKKMLSFVAIALLVMGLATSAFGAYASTDCYDTKYTIVNTAAVAKTSVVPTSLIKDNAEFELLKVDVCTAISGAAGTTGEAVVGIYDASAPQYANNASLECELEASSTQETASKSWVRPLKIYNGVVVVQGAYSVVSIEYQRAGR